MTLTDWTAHHGNEFQSSRALVTGGAGFIGSHLTEALLSLGADVVVLDDLSGGERANVEAAAHAAGAAPTFMEGSILDETTLREAMTGCRHVFHQAALASVPASVAEPARFHAVNDVGTFRVLEAAREAGAERVMFAASSAAYGSDEALPKTETMAPEPMSPYAATKTAGESWLRAHGSSYELDTAALRYFNIFGPRQNANSAYAAVIAAFAKAMLTDQAATIHGDGEQSRDFVFIDNVVQANLLAARANQRLNGRVMNVGCGRRISVNQLHGQMASLLDRPDQPRYEAPRPGDVRHSLADLTRTEQTLGYEPLVGVKQGLEPTLEWYHENLASQV